MAERIYRFSYVGLSDTGVQVVNDLHYHVVPPLAGSQPDPADVLAGIDGHLRTAYRACLSLGYNVNSAELRQMVAPWESDIPVAASLNVNQAGTLAQSDTKLPVPMAAIVKLRSNAALRSGRGYLALPSPRQSTYIGNDGKWTGTFATNMQTLAALLDDVLELGSVDPSHAYPVVYSRTRHERNESPWWFDVVEGIPRQVPSWRRSRMSAP